MKKIFSLFFIFVGIQLSAQDVKSTSITIFQKTYNVRFLVINDEAYVNWNEVMTALPGWFSINNSGQIEVSPIIQLAVLNAKSDKYSATTETGSSGDVIESTIDGEFDGWDGETIFKLTNGQIWQQSMYAYTYHYAYRPKVIIIKNNGRYLMKVDGVSGTIQVTRLK